MKLACFAVLTAAVVFGQQPPSARPAFEVASVKPAPPPTGGGIYSTFSGGPGTRDPGTITQANVSLRDLIRTAYGVKDYQISAPAWLSTARFDIVAKVPANTPKEQVPLMWQTLLAERFQLTVHTESKELPVFALVVAKNGPKLKESAPDEAPMGTSNGPAGSSGGGGGGSAPRVGLSIPRDSGAPTAPSGVHRMSGSGMPMSRLAEMLSRVVDRPVVDMTELTGVYDLKLSYSSDDADVPAAPSIYTAVEQQLGLKLEPRKSPVQILVIDHVEKVPTEN